jgi:hypothetical protein
MLLMGIWEVGRIVEVNQVVWGAAREGARQCSTGTLALNQVATQVTIYLVNAEPNAFNLPAGTTLTMSETTSGTLATVTVLNNGSELLTIQYQDLGSSTNPNPTSTDPTTASQLDKFMFSVSAPYHNVAWTMGSAAGNGIVPGWSLGDPRFGAVVYWYSLIDTPIVVNPQLPVQ